MIAWRYFVAVTLTSFIATSSVIFLLLLWALFRHFPSVGEQTYSCTGGF